jgi:hypothetical protein
MTAVQEARMVSELKEIKSADENKLVTSEKNPIDLSVEKTVDGRVYKIKE